MKVFALGAYLRKLHRNCTGAGRRRTQSERRGPFALAVSSVLCGFPLGCPTGIEPVTSGSTDRRSNQLSYGHHALRATTPSGEEESKPGSVLMVISLEGATHPRPRRRLRGCSRLPASASHRLDRLHRRLLQGGLPFSPARTSRSAWSLLLSRWCTTVPLWTVDGPVAHLPGFRQAPRSMQPGLSSTLAARVATILLLPPPAPVAVRFGAIACQSTARASGDAGDELGCRRGDLNSHALTGTTP